MSFKKTLMNTNMLSMIVMVVLLGLGEKMAERFLPIYVLSVGGSAFAVGFLNFMDNLLGAIYSPIGGYVSDKVGFKKALRIFTLLAMVGYAIVIFVPAWQAVLVGALFFISWTAISLPAVMSMVSKVVPKNQRTMGVSIHSLVRRIPMALGPVVGGLLIAAFGRVLGIRVAFAVAFVLAGFSLVFIDRYMQDEVKVTEQTGERKKLTFSKDLKNLLISDILIRFSEQIPYAFIGIYVIDHLGFTPIQFGYLTVIEMIVAMLVYIPVAYMADKYGKKQFVLTTFFFFTAFPLVLNFANSYWMLVLAFVIRGLKEFGEPTRKALIMDLAEEDAKARTFGAYYFFRDVVVSLSALASAWLWLKAPSVNFLTATAFGVIGILWFWMYGKDVESP
jgi:MFS family permease